jgi:hypothetical protein
VIIVAKPPTDSDSSPLLVAMTVMLVSLLPLYQYWKSRLQRMSANGEKQLQFSHSLTANASTL